MLEPLPTKDRDQKHISCNEDKAPADQGPFLEACATQWIQSPSQTKVVVINTHYAKSIKEEQRPERCSVANRLAHQQQTKTPMAAREQTATALSHSHCREVLMQRKCCGFPLWHEHSLQILESLRKIFCLLGRDTSSAYTWRRVSVQITVPSHAGEKRSWTSPRGYSITSKVIAIAMFHTKSRIFYLYISNLIYILKNLKN